MSHFHNISFLTYLHTKQTLIKPIYIMRALKLNGTSIFTLYINELNYRHTVDTKTFLPHESDWISNMYSICAQMWSINKNEQNMTATKIYSSFRNIPWRVHCREPCTHTCAHIHLMVIHPPACFWEVGVNWRTQEIFRKFAWRQREKI